MGPLEPHLLIVGMFRETWANRNVAWDMAVVPMILSFALAYGFAYGLEISAFSPAGLLLRVLDFVPTTMFLVAWQRYLMIGAEAVPGIPGLTWGTRETEYLLHYLKLAAVPLILILPAVAGGGLDVRVLLFVGLPATIAVLLALTLAFGLTASALDLKWSLSASWQYSRGQRFTLLGILLLPSVASAFVAMLLWAVLAAIIHALAGPADATNAFGRIAVLTLVHVVVSYATTAVTGAALAMIFRALTGHRPGVGVPSQPI
jgi:hypothetical protein